MTHIDPPLPKVHARHRDRLAIVYVRQSTPHQVADHRESADLQYQFRQRAVSLGWPESRVLVIDDDQGLSGQSIDNRPGLQRLLAEVSLGRVCFWNCRRMRSMSTSIPPRPRYAFATRTASTSSFSRRFRIDCKRST